MITEFLVDDVKRKLRKHLRLNGFGLTHFVYYPELPGDGDHVGLTALITSFVLSRSQMWSIAIPKNKFNRMIVNALVAETMGNVIHGFGLDGIYSLLLPGGIYGNQS
jgi:hypothetical protein